MSANLLELNRQINTEAAAEFLGVTQRKLEAWRQTGGGPQYVRISRRIVRYRLCDLIEFQETHLRRNTSEAAAYADV